MSPPEKLTVLVVDDQQEHAESVEQSITRLLDEMNESADVRAITHGEELRRVVCELGDGKGEAVIVLLDEQLGQAFAIEGQAGDGWSVQKHYRKNLPRAKFVLYSAQGADPKRMQEAINAGFCDWLARDNIQDAQSGLVMILAQFAVIVRRLRMAKAEPTRGGDPMAQLLLRVRIGLLLAGRHGHIWWQNLINEEMNLCPDAEGQICHRLFHGWRCLTRSCPWCPTLAAIEQGGAIHRVLLLPLRHVEQSATGVSAAGDDAETHPFCLACVDMSAEPIWAQYRELPDAAQQWTCGGALESVLDRTAEWRHKAPAHRVLDLLVMTTGLVAAQAGPVRVNLHGISRSGLRARPVASCLVLAPTTGNHVPRESSQPALSVAGSTPDWEGAALGPGPIELVAGHDLQTTDNVSSFPLDEYPADVLRKMSGEFDPQEAPSTIREAGWYDVQGATWSFRVLVDDENGPVALLEIASEHDAVCPQCRCSLGERQHCDTELYLTELARHALALRKERDALRGQKITDRATLGRCRTREEVWQAVEHELGKLRQALGLEDDALWWHFRELRLEPCEGEQHSGDAWCLTLDEEAAQISRSPYARHGLELDEVARVALPARDQWAVKREKLRKEHGPDPSNWGPIALTGSYICHIMARERTVHTRPPENACNYPSVLKRACKCNVDRAGCERLRAVRSYGDWPVGITYPIGTFHIHCTDDDLFAPKQVTTFIAQLVEVLADTLLRLEVEEQSQQIREGREADLKRHSEGYMRDDQRGSRSGLRDHGQDVIKWVLRRNDN